MSINVPLPELGAALIDHPWGYIVTVSDEPRARSIAVSTQYVDGLLVAMVGQGTLRNIAARPYVSMVFPPKQADGYSLIVDGTAVGYDDHVEITPTSAVRHRPAPVD